MKVKDLITFIGDRLNVSPKLSITKTEGLNCDLLEIHDVQITDNRVYLSVMDDSSIPTFVIKENSELLSQENMEKDIIISFTDFTGELDEYSLIETGDVGVSENHFYLNI